MFDTKLWFLYIINFGLRKIQLSSIIFYYYNNVAK